MKKTAVILRGVDEISRAALGAILAAGVDYVLVGGLVGIPPGLERVVGGRERHEIGVLFALLRAFGGLASAPALPNSAWPAFTSRRTLGIWTNSLSMMERRITRSACCG